MNITEDNYSIALPNCIASNFEYLEACLPVICNLCENKMVQLGGVI